MTVNKESMYWNNHKEYMNYDPETERYSVKPNAPERVKKSFEMWKEKNPDHAS